MITNWVASNNKNPFFLSLESQKSKIRALEEAPSCLFQLWWLLGWWLHHSTLCLCLHVAIFLCLLISSHEDTLALIQSDLILTNRICKAPISK